MKNKKSNYNYSQYYGIYGMQYVWHGEWADPEIIWHGHAFNFYDVDTAMRDLYENECREFGVKPDSSRFPTWIKNHAYLAREYMTILLELKEKAL